MVRGRVKTVTLQVSRPVPAHKNPTNQYALILCFMHGDADHDSVNTLYFDADSQSELETMKRMIVILDEMSQDYEVLEFQSGAKEYMRQRFKDPAFTPAIDWIGDNWDYDITMHDSGYMAHCSGFGVAYYDAQGNQFNVDVTIKDNKSV